MIQEVEHIDTKLEFASLPNREEPPQRQIQLCQSKASNVVATFGSLSRSIRYGERIGIKRMARRSVGISDPNGLTWHEIGARSCEAARRISKDYCVKWESASCRNDRL